MKKKYIQIWSIVLFSLLATQLMATESEAFLTIKAIVVGLLGSHFATTTTFSIFLIGISAVIFKVEQLANLQNIVKQLITLTIGVGLSLIGYAFDIGVFESKNVAESILLAIPIAFEGNGFFMFGKNLRDADYSEVRKLFKTTNN